MVLLSVFSLTFLHKLYNQQHLNVENNVSSLTSCFLEICSSSTHLAIHRNRDFDQRCPNICMTRERDQWTLCQPCLHLLSVVTFFSGYYVLVNRGKMRTDRKKSIFKCCLVKKCSLILNRLLMEHVLLVSVLHYTVGLEVSSVPGCLSLYQVLG